jgi:hypothetical protein
MGKKGRGCGCGCVGAAVLWAVLCVSDVMLWFWYVEGG